MAIFNDLATEIWIQILQEVTAVPDDLLDPELILVVESCGTLMLSDFAEQRYLEALVSDANPGLFAPHQRSGMSMLNVLTDKWISSVRRTNVEYLRCARSGEQSASPFSSSTS